MSRFIIYGRLCCSHLILDIFIQFRSLSSADYVFPGIPNAWPEPAFTFSERTPPTALPIKPFFNSS